MAVQSFNGESYWKCGKYWQRRGRRLHRIVWEFFNGPIPKGMHVHHRDQDVDNNSIDNLELMPAERHSSWHAKISDHTAWHTAMRNGSAKWHRSPEGKKFHSELGKANGLVEPRFEHKCRECNEIFRTRRRSCLYCSGKCEQRVFRRQHPGYRERFAR